MTSFPDFYDPAKVGTMFTPNVDTTVREGLELGLPSASTDEHRVLLLLVDPQVDFIHTDGSLSVPGAVEDTQRIIEWLFTNIDRITTIAASLDTHTPMQIFYPGWWHDAEGNAPAPFTLISPEDLEIGRWQPTREPEWSRQYVNRLQEKSKKVLTIWPYHTMLGTPGHAISPALYEAITYLTAARQTSPEFLVKGRIPKTEHYSMLEPEVTVPEAKQGTLNLEFVDFIAGYNKVFIAGQAKSHCVLETTQSLVTHFGQIRPELIEHWYVLMDATSSVVHPEVDFEGMAQSSYAHWQMEHNLNLVTTATVSA